MSVTAGSCWARQPPSHEPLPFMRGGHHQRRRPRSSSVPRARSRSGRFCVVCAAARQRARWCWAAAVGRRAVPTLLLACRWAGSGPSQLRRSRRRRKRCDCMRGPTPGIPVQISRMRARCAPCTVHGASGNGIPVSRAKSRGQVSMAGISSKVRGAGWRCGVPGA